MADYVGKQFGNYRLLHTLGRGGFAEVYLGEHIYLNTQAAVKVLHTQLASDQNDQFLAEARTIARLEHPHIVRVLEFGLEEGMPFLVMTYAPNGTVRQQHPRGQPLPLPRIVQYVQQTADALQYAHDQRLIHRDIKPENILLGRRNEILLSDFGIATLVQSSRQDMREVTGTVAYMAPEQLQGKPRLASDQYALGVVVYEWLSGACPFTGTFTEVASQHMFVQPPLLRDKVSAISPQIEQVVMTALAKDPQQRFANIWTFSIALEQACEVTLLGMQPSQRGQLYPYAAEHAGAMTEKDEAMLPTIISSQQGQTPIPPAMVSSTPPALIQQPLIPRQAGAYSELQAPSEQKVPRRVVVIGLVGVAALAGIGGGAALLALSRPWGIVATPTPVVTPVPNTPTASPTTASSPVSDATTQPSTTPPSPPVLGTIFTVYRGHSSYVYGVTWVTRDGRRIASAGFDRTVQEWNATSGNQYFVYNHANAVNDVKASHDGTHIASAGEDMIVKVRDALTGANLLTYSGHLRAVYTVNWSPDGTRIVSSSADATAQVWDASTGNNLITYSGHTAAVWSAVWSPDGTRVVSAGADNTAQVWDAVTGNLLVTYRGHSATIKSVTWSPDGRRIATASEDQTVQVWNSSTGAPILTYRGHSNVLRSVAWSHDGTRIVSGGKDATAQIWNAGTGNTIYIFRGHTATVFDAQWSRDDTHIVSGGTDTTVQVWQAT